MIRIGITFIKSSESDLVDWLWHLKFFPHFLESIIASSGEPMFNSGALLGQQSQPGSSFTCTSNSNSSSHESISNSSHCVGAPTHRHSSAEPLPTSSRTGSGDSATNVWLVERGHSIGGHSHETIGQRRRVHLLDGRPPSVSANGSPKPDKTGVVSNGRSGSTRSGSGVNREANGESTSRTGGSRILLQQHQLHKSISTPSIPTAQEDLSASHHGVTGLFARLGGKLISANCSNSSISQLNAGKCPTFAAIKDRIKAEWVFHNNLEQFTI